VVGDWIEQVDNPTPMHSGLGMISTVEFEHQLAQAAYAA
jgi:hypothetical protein